MVGSLDMNPNAKVPTTVQEDGLPSPNRSACTILLRSIVPLRSGRK
jgi:hypothetical protein